MTDHAARALKVALNCTHGRWVGVAQFAACVPCIAAALAEAHRERGDHTDWKALADEVERREQDAAALRARVKVLEGAVNKWREYVEWLTDRSEGPITIAFAHGWRCPQADIDGGKRRREELAALTPPAPSPEERE